MPEKMSDSKNKLKKPRLSSEDSYSSSSTSSFSSSSEDETDAKDLKSIKEYLTDRKELAAQLFKSVKAEKIRMMLPQSLKKMELCDLEELCVAELTGMSKKRIMCIINDQEMLESSETDESDDSGPSLEIISDTEWISEDETNVKIEGVKTKNKKDTKKMNKKSRTIKNSNSKDKSKIKTQRKVKMENDGNQTNVKIKTEKKPKEKEGESLLDLLELQMRARAIRALIRKEEGTSQQSNSKTDQESGTSIKTKLLKEQLESIDVIMKHGDDEDLFVVIHPAPTINLLSSDSENDDSTKRVNKKLINERLSENKNTQEKTADKIINDKNENVIAGTSAEKDKVESNNKKLESLKESFNLPMSVCENGTDDKQVQSNVSIEDLEEGEIIDNVEDDKVDGKGDAKDSNENVAKKIKKIKKNPHIRSRKESKDSDENVAESSNNKKNEKEEPIEIEESPSRETEMASLSKETEIEKRLRIDIDDNKSLEIEEIINLDDYPDDMDIVEKNETNENEKVTTIDNKTRSETWASRYVKQDDVQNVIKESKIQSEIRKRLRERQRQSKKNMTETTKNDENLQPSPELEAQKPLGSVEEYLALKALSGGNIDDNIDNSEKKIATCSSTVEITNLEKNPVASCTKNYKTLEEVLKESNEKHNETTNGDANNEITNIYEKEVILKQDEYKSDSSDDNITVKIGNTISRIVVLESNKNSDT